MRPRILLAPFVLARAGRQPASKAGPARRVDDGDGTLRRAWRLPTTNPRVMVTRVPPPLTARQPRRKTADQHPAPVMHGVCVTYKNSNTKVRMNTDPAKEGRIYAELNESVQRVGAAWVVDLLSGGFKFNDEVPLTHSDDPDLMIPLINVLRRLWAYRMSLVKGEPRTDLTPLWDLVRQRAPNWAGFAPERCSKSMAPAVDSLKLKQLEFKSQEAKLFGA